MNERRISLSRILAVNWYGFRQIIDVSGHTLVAGAFGTGKTALLDLMQYVLLGNQWRPNRAAAGNARSRSLLSYCLCDTNTQQNGQPHYTRPSGVTVIALEFTWPQESRTRSDDEAPRRETWGMRIEYSSPSADPRFTWFGIPDRIGWEQIAPGGAFLDEENFRTWLRREYGREAIFSRQVDYLAEMATPNHLWFEADAFSRTLPRAIAFEPEGNVEKFIREFVLEESPLDVRDVRTSVTAYRDTQATLANQRDEAVHLEEVCTHHDSLIGALQEAAICRQSARQFHYEQLEERRRKADNELSRLRSDSSAEREDLQRLEQEEQETAKIVEATRLEVGADPKAVELEKLQRERGKLQHRIQQAKEKRKSQREQLHALRQRWNSWLASGLELAPRDKLCAALPEALAIDPAAIESLVDPDETAVTHARLKLAEDFSIAWSRAAEIRKEVGRQAETHRQRLQQLTTDIETLERNEELGACPVFRALREKLGDRVRQLGRLIEVRPKADRWWPALEVYLGPRRLVLVVSREDYKEALAIVRKTPPGREPESLLNPFEAAQLPATVQPGSLATKVEIEDPLAKNYVHHLLGEVICVEDIAELDASPAKRAITPEGIYKQVPLRRRILPERDIPLTLGVRGRERLREAREKERLETRREFDRIELLGQDLDTWLERGKQSGLGATGDSGTLPSREEFDTMQREFRTASETIRLLSTPEREERIARLKEHEQTQKRLLGKIGVLKAALDQFLHKEKRLADDLASAREKATQLERELLQARALLPPSVTPERIAAIHDEIAAAHPGWNERVMAANERAGKAETRAEAARAGRDNARRRLIESASFVEPEKRHPQYRADFDLTEEDNTRWEARLTHLRSIEIPKFETLAQERRRDWENLLRRSVLDRLKERLDRAESDIKALRHYLSHPVGRHRYTITQRRDPTLGNIWSLLDTGFEPTDELLAGGPGDATATALDELMHAVDASGGELDERARRLLDYRHYHHYDIEMTMKDDPTAPAISLGRSMRSLSGGENQAPFFISMLAAFRRVYDLGSERSLHLGLVVMDEAFSKLSGDGVEDCLELAANFRLQLVMAFPIDRLGLMAPHADTVIICRKEETRDARGYITRIDNIPHRITAQEAIESLE